MSLKNTNQLKECLLALLQEVTSGIFNYIVLACIGEGVQHLCWDQSLQIPCVHTQLVLHLLRWCSKTAITGVVLLFCSEICSLGLKKKKISHGNYCWLVSEDLASTGCHCTFLLKPSFKGTARGHRSPSVPGLVAPFCSESPEEAACRHVCSWQKPCIEQRHVLKRGARLSSLPPWMRLPLGRGKATAAPTRESLWEAFDICKMTLCFHLAARADSNTVEDIEQRA